MKKMLTPFLLFLIIRAQSQSKAISENEQHRPVIAIQFVRLKYLHDPYADYLFYLLYREPKDYPLDSLLKLNSIPTLPTLISIQEIVASAQIKSYHQIYKYAELYRTPKSRKIDKPVPKIIAYSDQIPNYDSLMFILQQGEAHFDTFYRYWKEKIEPDELKTIQSWRTQDSMYHPFETLQQIERIKFKSHNLDVGCIALHLAGSGNYSPPGVYTSIFRKPDLSRVLGHEGTHLLLTPYYGRDWRKHALAQQAIELAGKNNLTADDLEEMLCIFMQTKLSQQFGYTDPSKRMSVVFREEKAKQELLAAMEDNWDDYLSNRRKYKDIIAFMLTCATSAFQKPN